MIDLLSTRRTAKLIASYIEYSQRLEAIRCIVRIPVGCYSNYPLISEGRVQTLSCPAVMRSMTSRCDGPDLQMLQR